MNYQQYLLIKLAEESSELAQIALKTAQFGLYSTCPITNETNIQRVTAEYNDVIAITEMINTEIYDNLERDTYLVDAKKQKVMKYLEYSKEAGCVVE